MVALKYGLPAVTESGHTIGSGQLPPPDQEVTSRDSCDSVEEPVMNMADTMTMRTMECIMLGDVTRGNCCVRIR